MLFPRPSNMRSAQQITGLWNFCTDPKDEGIEKRWFSGMLISDLRMSTSASYNDLFPGCHMRDYVGPVWYQKQVWLPAVDKKQSLLLYFESVTHEAAVWIDDEQVCTHSGGYLPFEMDITRFARRGRCVRITVRVDNRLSFTTIPPGIVVKKEFGFKQHYWHDFFNYAGIHRPVWLAVVPKARIEDITAVTELKGEEALIHYETAFAGGERVSVELFDAAGALAAQGNNGCVRLVQPHLWQPGRGYLYTALFSLWDNDGQLLDSYPLRLGVRTVSVQGNQLLVNGQRVYLRGFGMHEDHEIIGKGHSDALMLHDMALLEWTGANSFRTSHYPYAQAIMDYADERGLLVIDETPAVGLNLINGGIFPGADMQTFSDQTISRKTQQVHAQCIQDLISRDKNHPCVIIWSIANEPESQTDAAKDYFAPLFAIARQADPSRPVGFTNMALATYDSCKVAQFADVILLNRYYGWYMQHGDLRAAEAALRQELMWWQTLGKPCIMTEYGADTMSGLHSIDAEPWSEEYQAAFLKMYHRVFDSIEAMAGEHIWNFADFATYPGTMRVGGNRKGVFTRNRKPKACVFDLKQRWSSMPLCGNHKDS